MMLGLVLFSAFIRDLEKVMNSGESNFVGDAKLFQVAKCADGKKISVRRTQLKEDRRVKRWQINIYKCKLMHLGEKKAKT